MTIFPTPPGDLVSLGRTDLQVSRLGMGTNPLGGLYEDIPIADKLATVERAWERGVRFYDTAPAYGLGNAERALGSVLSEKPRDEFVIASKVGRVLLPKGQGDPAAEDAHLEVRGEALYKNVPDVVPYFAYDADGIRRSIEDSLERLGLDRLDVVHIHDPDDYQAVTGSRDEAYARIISTAYPALEQLRSEGVIKAIGVGISEWQLLMRFMRDGDFDCFLLAGRYTLLDTSALPELMPEAERRGISVIVGGVYNSGLLCHPEPRRASEVSADAGRMEEWARSATFDYLPAPAEWTRRAQQLADVCGEFGIPLMAAALQFPYAHPAVDTVVMGPRSVAEVDQNADLLDVEIPDELWRTLVDRNLLPPDAPTSASTHGRGEQTSTDRLEAS